MRAHLRPIWTLLTASLFLLLAQCSEELIEATPDKARSNKAIPRHRKPTGGKRGLLEACSGSTEWSCQSGNGALQIIPDALHAAILSSSCTLLLPSAAVYGCGPSVIDADLYQAVMSAQCSQICGQAARPCPAPVSGRYPCLRSTAELQYSPVASLAA